MKVIKCDQCNVDIPPWFYRTNPELKNTEYDFCSVTCELKYFNNAIHGDPDYVEEKKDD